MCHKHDITSHYKKYEIWCFSFTRQHKYFTWVRWATFFMEHSVEYMADKPRTTTPQSRDDHTCHSRCWQSRDCGSPWSSCDSATHIHTYMSAIMLHAAGLRVISAIMLHPVHVISVIMLCMRYYVAPCSARVTSVIMLHPVCVMSVIMLHPVHVMSALCCTLYMWWVLLCCTL